MFDSFPDRSRPRRRTGLGSLDVDVSERTQAVRRPDLVVAQAPGLGAAPAPAPAATSSSTWVYWVVAAAAVGSWSWFAYEAHKAMTARENPIQRLSRREVAAIYAEAEDLLDDARRAYEVDRFKLASELQDRAHRLLESVSVVPKRH